MVFLCIDIDPIKEIYSKITQYNVFFFSFYDGQQFHQNEQSEQSPLTRHCLVIVFTLHCTTSLILLFVLWCVTPRST